MSQLRGESHPKARIKNSVVVEMRDTYQRWCREGQAGRMGAPKGYGALAIIFDCSPWTARDICTYRTRIDAH